MDTNLAQMKIVSSLDKVRLGDDVSNLGVTKLTALKGETINFQVYVKVDLRSTLPVRVESVLSDFATLYQVVLAYSAQLRNATKAHLCRIEHRQILCRTLVVVEQKRK